MRFCKRSSDNSTFILTLLVFVVIFALFSLNVHATNHSPNIDSDNNVNDNLVLNDADIENNEHNEIIFTERSHSHKHMKHSKHSSSSKHEEIESEGEAKAREMQKQWEEKYKNEKQNEQKTSSADEDEAEKTSVEDTENKETSDRLLREFREVEENDEQPTVTAKDLGAHPRSPTAQHDQQKEVLRSHPRHKTQSDNIHSRRKVENENRKKAEKHSHEEEAVEITKDGNNDLDTASNEHSSSHDHIQHKGHKQKKGSKALPPPSIGSDGTNETYGTDPQARTYPHVQTPHQHGPQVDRGEPAHPIKANSTMKKSSEVKSQSSRMDDDDDDDEEKEARTYGQVPADDVSLLMQRRVEEDDEILDENSRVPFKSKSRVPFKADHRKPFQSDYNEKVLPEKHHSKDKDVHHKKKSSHDVTVGKKGSSITEDYHSPDNGASKLSRERRAAVPSSNHIVATNGGSKLSGERGVEASHKHHNPDHDKIEPSNELGEMDSQSNTESYENDANDLIDTQVATDPNTFIAQDDDDTSSSLVYLSITESLFYGVLLVIVVGTVLFVRNYSRSKQYSMITEDPYDSIQDYEPTPMPISGSALPRYLQRV